MNASGLDLRLGAGKGESPYRALISASGGCHRQISRMATIHDGAAPRSVHHPLPNWTAKPHREIADELAQTDADYAAGNIISGEDVRERFGLE
jgi:hypothetical protein